MSKQLNRIQECLDVRTAESVRHITSLTGKLDQLLHLMRDMVKLESHIDEVEGRILSRLDKMEVVQVDSSKLVDRLIEMSMVNNGQSQDAVVHRSQARVESNFSNPQSWGVDEEPEDVWPPKGCDAVDVTG